MCHDCSNSASGECKNHKQSPIFLEKEVTGERVCKDRHLMRYWAGECKFGDLKFEILPHVLRAYQPDVPCKGDDPPQIDFSKGFPRPWELKFTDVSVPSQHVIDGKSYDAEVVLSHTYSVNKYDRLIGNVSIMLEKGGPEDRYDFLDLYIRKWRREARRIKSHCFPDIYPQNRRHAAEVVPTEAPAGNRTLSNRGLWSLKRPGFHNPRFQKDTTWPQFLARANYDRYWHPYDWYIQANTEYYFRYEGSMPEPPCFEGVHWRILKDPIRVSPAQLRALNALLRQRLDPETCEYATASIPRHPGAQKKVSVNRPLQTRTSRHKLVFCECENWTSKADPDISYCQQTMADRGVLPYDNSTQTT